MVTEFKPNIRGVTEKLGDGGQADHSQFRPNVGVDLGAAEPKAPSQEPAQPEKSNFFEEFSKWSAGEREVFPYSEDDGIGKTFLKGIGNLLPALARAPLNLAQQSLNQGKVPELVKREEEQTKISDDLAIVNDNLVFEIRKLRKLEQAGDTKAGEALDRMRDAFAASTSQARADVFIPKSLDKSSLQAFGEFGETLFTVATLGSRGFLSLPAFKGVHDALFLPAGVAGPLASAFSKQGLQYAGLMGAEFAAYGALSRAALPNEEGAPATGRDMGEAAVLSGILGLITAPLAIGGSRLFGRKLSERGKEILRDSLETSESRASRGPVESPGFRRSTTINLRAEPAESVDNFAQGLEQRRTNFSTALAGDEVITASGIRGVVMEVETKAGGSAAAQEVLQQADVLRSGLADVLGDSRLTDTERKAAVAAIKETQEEVAKLVDTLPDVPKSAADKIELIKLKVEGGKFSKGDFVVTLDAKELTEGGVVKSRTYLEPNFPVETEAEFRAANPKIAKRLDEAADALSSQAHLSDRIYVQRADGSVLPLPANKVQRVTDKITEYYLRLAKQSVVDTEGFVPKRTLGGLGFWELDETNLRRMGIDPQFLHDASDLNEELVRGYFARLKPQVASVLKELGIDDADSLIGKLRLQFSPKVKAAVKQVSERLYDAAGGAEVEGLTKAQQGLLAEWKTVARDLLDRTNAVLVAAGKEPIKGVEDYITRVLTGQAQATYRLTGVLPNRTLEELFGRKVAGMLSNRNVDQVFNALTMKRSGGLPIKRDFFEAVDTAIRSHSRFAAMQPALTELDTLIARFDSVKRWSQAFSINVGYARKFAERLAGVSKSHEALRSFDTKMLEALTAKEWFGIPNPFANNAITKAWLVEEVETEAFGKLRVPSKGLIRAVERFGPGSWPSVAKRLTWASQLALSLPYVVLNLTQFPLYAVPKLRGEFLPRYKDAAKGWAYAWKAWFDPELRKMWKESGVLTENVFFEMLEQGDRRATSGLLGRKGGILSDITGFSSEFSEFINRVASAKAGYYNALSTTDASAAKSVNKIWLEMNDLTKGELHKEAERLGKKLADITQFKFGISHRAPIQDSPVLSLFDQFNSYTRNSVGLLKDMMRPLKNDPEVVAAWKDMWSGKPTAGRKFMRLLADPKRNAGERGDLIRFFMNGTAVFGGLTLVGAAWQKAFVDTYFFGGSRFLEPTLMALDGIRTMDEDKIDRGLKGLVLPPAATPVLDVAKDVAEVFDGNEKLSVRRISLSTYSPFRKPIQGIIALKAALTGEPQAIPNRLTGKAQYYIAPKDALNYVFFGYGGRASRNHVEELNAVSRARAEADAQGRARASDANEFLDEMLDAAPGADRLSVWDKWMMKGKMDEDLVNAVVENWRERRLFQSGAVERMLLNVPTEQRAEALRQIGAGMPKKDWQELLQLYAVQGIITPEVAGELMKGEPDDKVGESDAGIWAGMLGVGLSLKKDLHVYLDKVREAGWSVEKTGGGHWKLLSPDKSVPPIFTPDTPSDYRGLKNMLSLLKRHGLNLRK